MKCIILAAGFGTRLQEVYPNTPKALVPVAGKPIINYLLDNLQDLNMSEILVISNEKFKDQFNEWSQTTTLPVKVISNGVHTNEQRRGSIGDIAYALEHTEDDDMMILGSDNILGFKLSDFMQESDSPRIAVYDVQDLEVAKSYGIVETNDQNIIVNFLEKPENPPSTLASTLVYFFPKDSLQLLQRYISEGHNLDRAGDYIAWLVKNSTVKAYPFEGDWYDIGTPLQLKAANAHFSK